MATKHIGVKLEEEICHRLSELGKTRQRSNHWLVKEAVARYLDVEERYEQEKCEDDARWQNYLDTGNHLSHDEVDSWLNELADEAANKAKSR